MKFYFKIVAIMLTVTLLSITSIAYAQNSVNANSPTTSKLNAVAIVSNTSSPTLMNSNAWAVGDSGIIIRWNGNNWASVNSPTNTTLNSVIMVNSSYGLAVGGNSTSGVILKFDGNN
jgi:hypothetical protein